MDYSLPMTGSRRFREPQLPSYTPGVQLANKEPSECLQAGTGTAPKTPFHNTVPDTSPIRRLETRDSLGVSGGSEDCLFLKYIFTLIDICHIFTINYDYGSVYLPGNLGEKKDLPVVFWIHGYLFTRLFIHRQLSSYHFIYSQGAGMLKAMRPSSMVMI